MVQKMISVSLISELGKVFIKMKKKLVVVGLVMLLVLQILSPTFAYAQGTTESTTQSSKKESLSSAVKPPAASASTAATSATTATTTTSSSKDQTADGNSTGSSAEATQATTASTTKEAVKKQARAAIADNIFSSVKMYKINGDEVKPNDTLPDMTGIKLALKFSFSNKNYQTGDTFTTQLPAQVAIAKDLSGDFSPMTSAKWTIDAATKKLTITFLEDNVSSEVYDLTLTTSLEKVNGIDEENQKVVFDTAPTPTTFSIDVTSSVDPGKNTTALTMDTLNPKKATITSAFNLDRTDNNDRMYQVEGYNYGSKMSFESVNVYSSDVDFNGTLVGSKTLLTKDVDYTITYKNADSNRPVAEIKLLKSIGKKAVIAESVVSGIDGNNYVDESVAGNEYNYFYAYSYTNENGTQLNYTNASKAFVTLQPLEAKGKINPDTGNIDWEINYNFNEQPLTTSSQLLANLKDQGVELVDGSISIEKVKFNYTSENNYEVVSEGEGTSDFTITPDGKDSLSFTPKSATTQAYIVRYSTKITDPTERVIKNKVTNGTVTKEAQVSLIPNLVSKEAGTIDIFNRTMEWKITVNAEKYKMTNPVVHDYFIGAVKDYTGLTISKKISDTESVPLVENVDYKVTKFDENGSPVGAKPNVNGAPDSFNGGVRVDFLGDYNELKDTLVITIKTKIETSAEKTEIKNKATLNYGNSPGVIEYDAKGTFTDPYYTGGAKLAQTASTSGDYLYQNWLVFVNSTGANFNLTKMQDSLPAGTELVPGSLRFEEVTSQSMIDNIQRYLGTDYNLVPENSDAYPTKIDTANNQVNLEFGNLGAKRVYVKYRTRVKRDWYVYNRLDNVAKVTYDDKTPAEYKASVYAYNYEYALLKSVAKDPVKENVANWTVTTRNITAGMPVQDPEITDTLTPGTTNAAYDPTSFVVTDTATGEKISTDHYRLSFTGNTFKIAFSDYKAESNIQVKYNTVSEFPGGVKNNSQVNSSSYGALNAYYRQANTAVNLSFTNGSGTGVVKTADLDVLKVNEKDQGLAGATFEILKEDGTETGLKADTDAEGKLSFAGLPLGEYLLKESKAPNGYEINPEYKDGKAITLTENMAAIKVVNKETVANSVELTKTDEQTKDVLAGAKFRLEKADGTVISENHETGTDGRFTVKDLTIGDYQFVETEAPTGYALNKTPVTFSITERQGQVVNVTKTNTLSTGSVILTKVDEQSKETLKGATFQLQDKDGKTLQADLITDGNGKLEVADLAPGDYQFVETQAPTGYEKDASPLEFTITKAQSKAAEVEKTNAKTPVKPGSIALTKTDEKTGEALSGATFELKNEKGTVLESDLVTDKSGKIVLKTQAPGTYQLVETEAPTGYVKDTTPVTFTVKDQAETIELKKTNKAIVTGAVILEKVDEATKQPLPGAEFELQTQEGKTIKTATMSTDDNGRLAVEKLAPGKYQFVETKAPAGYQLDAKPVTFTIKADQTSPVHVTKTNKGKTIDGLTCTVALRKIDSKTGEGLADATFALQDQRGNVLKENLKTDKTGTLVVSDLEPGKYQLAETEAPKGYILNTKPVTFQLTTAKKRVVTVRKENVKKRTSAKEKGGSQATDTNKSHTTYGSNYSGRNHTYLPKTGEQKSMILVIIGVVVLLLLAGIVYIKRKK
jgi:LPXTG-motif cell wall-anchored protein